MRIALATERFLPHFGGVEFHVQALAAGLAARGHQVDVLAAEPSAPLGVVEIDSFSFRNFPSIPLIQGVRLPYGLILSAPAGYDLVHVHNYHSLALATIRNVACPVVLTPHFHGAGRTILLSALHRPYHAVAERWVDRADGVICVSRIELTRFARKFPMAAARATVIPNPIRTAFSVADLRSDSRLLVCVGRLEKYKRFDLAILALLGLPGWRLTLIGDGPERRNLELLAEKHRVSDRVTFTGRISDAAVNAYIHDARCVLQLSTLEAFGMTALEAVAARRPVIVSSGGAPAELAEAFPGWVHLCPSLDPADIIRAVHRAASSTPDRAPDLASFRPESVVEATLSVYERAISRFHHGALT